MVVVADETCELTKLRRILSYIITGSEKV